MGSAKAKGPDNNKRLALLEAIVSAAPVIAIAMVCHEANRVYCASLGDDSQPEWGDAPDWQRDSAIAGVEFHLANPDAGDAASHDKWMEHKLAEGWEVGEVKDPEAKTHPCLVPFDQLPPEQQFKDRLFRTLVHTVAGALAGVSAAHAAEQSGNADPADATAALEEQVRSLTEDLDKAHATIASFDKAAASRHRKGPKSSKARKVSPVEAGEGDVAAAMEAGEELELVFSNGSHEIVEFDPIRVFAPAFHKQGARRYVLRDAILVKGAGEEKRVRGVGLFAGGKQVGWCAFPQPVSVPVGGERKFDRMIVFG